ncbi:hypothetical protein [Stenotrophomonas sepilia]
MTDRQPRNDRASAKAIAANKKALTGVRAFQLEASSGIEPL